MAIYQKVPAGRTTKLRGHIRGYLWSKGRGARCAVFLDAICPAHRAGDPSPDDPPKVLQDTRFTPPSAFERRLTQECYLTLGDEAFLVSGWWSHDARPNAALLRRWPYYPWQGDISVMFPGKVKPFRLRASSALADEAVLIFIDKFRLSLQTGKPMATQGSRDPMWKATAHGSRRRH